MLPFPIILRIFAIDTVLLHPSQACRHWLQKRSALLTVSYCTEEANRVHSDRRWRALGILIEKIMTTFILKIYHYLREHRGLRLLSLSLITLLLVALVTRLNYKEDISDFLPLDSNHQNALKVYQDISGANKLIAIFHYKDTTKANPDSMVSAIDTFVQEVEERDTAHLVSNIMSRVDLEQMSEVADFVYSNIPYFLTDADYHRMDSVLERKDYISSQLAQDKQMLMFPTGGLLSDNIQRDPLNLFTPVVAQLQHTGNGMKYEMYDGCIFSPDMQRAVVILNSPFGASETENNTKLLTMLQSCSEHTAQQVGNIDIHLTGGPAIAVGNAHQIKTDSMLSVGIAVVLILALLLVTFRNLRNLLLIAVSIAWGWLFAMGGLALVHDNVSIIVIGISSVILGIAVNYPLHFIAHLSHTPDKPRALREIVMPLVVGNVTTVGAFLALVPLRSTALRDLGLFSSFLLIGTIVFVLIFLPHLSAVKQQAHHTVLDKIGNVSLENKRWLVTAVIILTLFFGYFSMKTSFDANISHINFMTDTQKADMEYFAKQMTHEGTGTTVYAVSTDTTMDRALNKSLQLQSHLQQLQTNQAILSHTGCSQFITSQDEQQRRLQRWQQFLTQHGDALKTALATQGQREGFSQDSFDDFYAILDETYQPHDITYFAPLTTSVFSTNLSTDSVTKTFNIVDVLTLDEQKVDMVEDQLQQQGTYSFDVASMNSAIANHLSDDFNYIGWACGCIVFFFLWISMGSIELAMLSFLPMAVSWVWILGIMGFFGLQFNIVNVILATFIFGQGDDYTIFMTEGACYEYAYRRQMLASYKHSIIISALIMFIGIGTLIFAQHPALHSLAEVTIAGMFSVVLMAYIFPPLIFKMLVRDKRGYRIRPVSLCPLLRMVWCTILCFPQLLLHSKKVGLLRFALLHTPGIQCQVINAAETINRCPVRIVCNDPSPIVRLIIQALCPSLVVQEMHNVSNFHGEHDEVDILPVVIHGIEHIHPQGSPCLYAGTITLSFLPRVTSDAQRTMQEQAEMKAQVRRCLQDEMARIARQVETADYFRPFVLDRYRYKGTEIYNDVKHELQRYQEKPIPENGEVVFEDGGYGASALLYALSHPDVSVQAVMSDDDKATVALYSAEGIAPNLRINKN